MVYSYYVDGLRLTATIYEYIVCYSQVKAEFRDSGDQLSTHSPKRSVPVLTPSELVVLSAFWQAKAEGLNSLRLSDAHERLSNQRKSAGETPPAITTISSSLRNLNAKGALREVRVREGVGEEMESQGERSRGIFSANTRSPHTGYQVTLDITDALEPTIKGLASLYPPDRRHELLADCARAMGLPKKIVEQIAELAKSAN
jgi:hypothetical protein